MTPSPHPSQLDAAPLLGIRVLDLSESLAGSQATMFLADYGAEVITVEPPAGSGLRAMPAYPILARGKKSLVLNLVDPSDLSVAQDLAARCDVVIESYRPGTADRMGLGYERVRSANPRVVYCSISGFGAQGPHVNLKGYEGIVMAKVGALGAVGMMVARPGPAFSAVPFASIAASQCALHAILSALFERESSGVGQCVEVSLAQALAALDPGYWYLHVLTQRYPEAFVAVPAITDDCRPNNEVALKGLVALTSDGHWLQFSQVQPHMFAPFMKALGLDWMFDDPQYAGLPRFDDMETRIKVWEQMLAAARLKTLAEWVDIMSADNNIWAEQFRTGRDLLDHPQLVHNKQIIEVFDPELGVVRQPDRMVVLKSGIEIQPAPRLGQHNIEIRALAALANDTTDPASAPIGELPLIGVTILEFGAFFAGPYGATVLTDLGARVIKVEAPEGDPMRGFFPVPETAAMKVLQGKESIAITLGTDESLKIVHELARRADIVLQSFRPGVARRLGIDAGTLQGLNPDLVYLHSPGYGVDGPCCDRPAFGMTIGAAVVALRNMGNSVDRRPELTIEELKTQSMRLWCATSVGIANCDGLSGLGIGSALLLGLLAKKRGAVAPTMLTTMLGNAAYLTCEDAFDYTGAPDRPIVDAQMRGYGSLYQLYEASDGWVFLAAPQEEEWKALAGALEAEASLLVDPRFLTSADRRENDAALTEVLDGVFLTRTAAQWERDLTAVDVACVVAETGSPEAILMSEDFGHASGYVAEVVHPLYDEVPRLSPLVRFSRSSTTVKPGCMTGQHTEAILREIGLSEESIADLRERKVIATW